MDCCKATPFDLVDKSKESLYGREADRDLGSACRCVTGYLFIFSERAAWDVGEGVRCQTFYLVFSMFSTPRAGLATNLYKIVFFGLATNTLNVREIAYETVYYYYLVWRCTYYIISVLLLFMSGVPARRLI